MEIVGLRRYPVKSMGGESLDRLELDHRGLTGDRWWAVADAEGRLASGKNTTRFRRHDAVFDWAARTDQGRVLVSGPPGEWVAGEPALDAAISESFGAPVRLAEEASMSHQDSSSISVIGTATLAWCADQWGIDADPRRLRVNIVISTDVAFIEEEWAGKLVAFGDTQLRMGEPIPRCRTIDIDQDGATATGRWLKHLATERDLRLAVAAKVAIPGVAHVGDQVTLG